LLKLAPVLERFVDPPPAIELTDTTAALLRSLGADPGDPARALGQVAATTPELTRFLTAALSVTFAPTMATASEKINVIPASAAVKVDCRVPPGLGEDVVRTRLAELLGPLSQEVSIEFTERDIGNASPVESEFMDAIRNSMAIDDPDGEVVPVVLPGFADSRLFRDAFPDCIVYGFFPQRHQTMSEAGPLVHGDNERIDLRDLSGATHFYVNLALNLLGRSDA
jgi:acetylornithine deacetylase/succinyl-diaminopimelate desuccinylase-like protein